jgi:acyl-CoA reductase-like NAD-dependent aldehyde dehydrogenase
MIASKIQAGNVCVNENNTYKIDNPFGGYKESCIGRAGGESAFYEISNIKTIAIAK